MALPFLPARDPLTSKDFVTKLWLRWFEAAQTLIEQIPVLGGHHATHENGGSDELNVTGLSGVLATLQPPAAHTHPVTDISGIVPDGQIAGSVARQQSANLFTAARPIELQHTRPGLDWHETDQGVDLKRWRMEVQGGTFSLWTVTDALAYDAQAFYATRVGDVFSGRDLYAGRHCLVTGTIFANGGQIAFPSTPAPSADPNTIDAYEEAPWTPTDASGAGLVLTIDAATRSTQIGNQVTVGADITFPATADGSAVTIGGLPVPVSAAGTKSVAIGACRSNAGIPLAVQASRNSSNLVLLNPTTAAAITNAQMSGCNLRVTVTYWVD